MGASPLARIGFSASRLLILAERGEAREHGAIVGKRDTESLLAHRQPPEPGH